MSDPRKTRPLAAQDTVAAPTASSLDVPARLGAVAMERPLGKGGMGVVWLGRHEILGRDVAVKFLTDAVEQGDPGFAAFVEGARAAAAVRHEGLVEVHDAGVVGGASGGHVPYLVMELVDGPGLDAVLRVCGPLSLNAALSVMDQVCRAIGELHGAGFVHRDIKPANILFDSEGRAHVTDFGLACERPVRGVAKVAVSGTPAYMAPETFRGEVSARSDVYALAIMFFELITGEPPFSGDVLAARRAHEAAPLPKEGLVARGVPEAIIDLIERGVVKNGMLRPRSAQHWLESLHATVPDRSAWESGARELRALVARTIGSPSDVAAAPDSTSYYQTISEKAELKRSAEPASVERPGTPPQPTELISAGAKCTACGYLLEGLHRGSRCPECGKAVDESLAARPLPCIGCEYNLIGIDAGGVCPECGRKVKESIWPSRLIFADATWIKRTATGAGLLAWGLWLMPILVLTVAALSVIFLSSTAFAAIGRAIGLATGFGLITSAVLTLSGLLTASTREPGGHGSHLLRWMRLAWLTAAALLVASLIARWTAPNAPVEFMVMPGIHLFLVGVVLLGAAAERFGRRIPDRKLIRAGRSVFWPWVVFLIIWTAVASTSAGWVGIGAGSGVIQTLSFASFIGMIYAASLAQMLHKRLKAAASLALPFDPGPSPATIRLPIPWPALGAAVLVFAALLVPLFLLGETMRGWSYAIAERYSLLDPMRGGGMISVAGRVYNGHPPWILSAPITALMIVTMYCFPVAMGLYIYFGLGLSRVKPRGMTRCGWCGYVLDGLREARCPECGVAVGGRPERGNPHAVTPRKRRRAILRNISLASMVFPLVMGLTYVALIAPFRLQEPGPTVEGVQMILATHIPAFLASVVVFHLLAQGTAGIGRKTRCGGCGAEMTSGTCACGCRITA